MKNEEIDFHKTISFFGDIIGKKVDFIFRDAQMHKHY